MNYLDITKTDIANGPGVRVTLWCSGCNVHCPGCHSQFSWDFSAGHLFDWTAMDKLMEYIDQPWIRGLTLSGGNPLEANNIPWILKICLEFKRRFPQKDLWLYTGYELCMKDFERIDMINEIALYRDAKKIIQMCDVIVDGPFIQEKRDVTLQFRGSSNQRLIDVKKTIDDKEITLWRD